MKEQNPFRVHSTRLFIPHVAHFIRQRGAIRGTTRTELRCYTAYFRILYNLFLCFILAFDGYFLGLLYLAYIGYCMTNHG